MKINRICDAVAAWMGIFGVNWEADFPDDGYRDLRGRAPLCEPVWISDLEPETPVVRVIRSEPAARRA